MATAMITASFKTLIPSATATKAPPKSPPLPLPWLPRLPTPALWMPALASTAAAAVVSALLSPPLPAIAKEKASLFDFNLTLPIMMVQFLLLMVALDKIYFTPLGKFMDERDAMIKEKLNSVKDMSGEVRQLEEEAAAMMRAARVEIAASMNKMKKEMQEEMQRMVAEKREKVQEELKAAMERLAIEKEEAIKALESQISVLSDQILRKTRALMLNRASPFPSVVTRKPSFATAILEYVDRSLDEPGAHYPASPLLYTSTMRPPSLSPSMPTSIPSFSSAGTSVDQPYTTNTSNTIPSTPTMRPPSPTSAICVDSDIAESANAGHSGSVTTAPWEKGSIHSRRHKFVTPFAKTKSQALKVYNNLGNAAHSFFFGSSRPRKSDLPLATVPASIQPKSKSLQGSATAFPRSILKSGAPDSSASSSKGSGCGGGNATSKLKDGRVTRPHVHFCTPVSEYAHPRHQNFHDGEEYVGACGRPTPTSGKAAGTPPRGRPLKKIGARRKKPLWDAGLAQGGRPLEEDSPGCWFWARRKKPLRDAGLEQGGRLLGEDFPGCWFGARRKKPLRDAGLAQGDCPLAEDFPNLKPSLFIL